MLKYLFKYRFRCFLIVLLSVFLGGMDVFKGIALQLIIDTSVGNETYSFVFIFAIITAFVVFNFITYYLFQKSMIYIGTRAVGCVREDIIDSIIFDYNNGNNCDNMDILSMLNRDIDIVFNKYFIGFFSLVRIAMSFFLATAYLLSVNVWLTLVILVLGSVSVILPNFFIQKSGAYKKAYSESSSVFFNSMKELLYGLNTIQLYGVEKDYRKKNVETNSKFEQARGKTMLFDGVISIVSSCVSFLVLATNVIVAGYLSQQGYFTIGTVLAVMQIMNYVLSPLSQGPILYAEMKSVHPIIDNVKKYISNTPRKSKNKISQTIECISVSNVSFKYPTSILNALSDICIDFEGVNKYAIIGASGCGKSTLFKILSMLENNYSGCIRVNKADLREIEPSSWRRKIAVVTQDTFLFDGTLRYNICLDNSIADNQLLDLIEKVGLTDFVNSLPDGINSSMGENGSLISGGEKQRIAIARALVRNADVLLLDEATSALDIQNANNIENLILSLDKMVIVITHKYDDELLERFDSIIKMDNGHIVKHAKQ